MIGRWLALHIISSSTSLTMARLLVFLVLYLSFVHVTRTPKYMILITNVAFPTLIGYFYPEDYPKEHGVTNATQCFTTCLSNGTTVIVSRVTLTNIENMWVDQSRFCFCWCYGVRSTFLMPVHELLWFKWSIYSSF